VAPDCGLKELLALHHLVLKSAVVAVHWDSILIIVTERYTEYDYTNILEHFDPFAAFIHPLGTYSDQLISGERDEPKLK